MNTLAAFSVLLLASFCSSAPISDDVLVITPEFFPDSLSVYTSQHDIVNLFVPLNSINFDENSEIEDLAGDNIYLFFVEADITGATTDYKGLYVFKNKVATKLLDNGRDFTATSDDSKQVFLAATDGIYTFNAKENKAEKYGTVSDSFVSIAITNGSSALYALTEDRVLYKITDEGTNKEVVSDVKDAVQIVFDFEDNLYFLDSKKHVYVKNEEGVQKVKGLPNSPSVAKLIRPPFISDDGVLFLAGKKVYEVKPNATSEYINLFLETRPTASSVEAALLQYHAYQKQIYQYNLLAIIMGAIDLDEVQTYLSDKSEDIKKMGSKPKKSFRTPN